jgi:hypothetical protein
MGQQLWSNPLVTALGDGPTVLAAAAASCLPTAARCTLPPGAPFWYPGKQIRLTASGRISCAAGAPGTARFDVRFGSAIVFDSQPINLNLAGKTGVGWLLELLLTCRTVGGGNTATGWRSAGRPLASYGSIPTSGWRSIVDAVLDDSDPAPDNTWTWPDIAAAVGFVLLVVWALAAFGTDGMSTRLMNAGEAVGAVSGGLAAGAFIIGLRQLSLQRTANAHQGKVLMEQLELQRAALEFALQQNRETADRAHRDKLADAYAEWFRIARTELAEAARALSRARLIFQHDRPRSEDAMMGRRHVKDGLRFATELRLASTKVLLLEDNEQLRKQVKATFAPFFPGATVPRAILATAVNADGEVLRRLTAVEALYSDVIVRLRGGERPEPAVPESELENVASETVAEVDDE